MPAKGEGPQLLVDTSIAVALVVADHEHNAVTHEALAGLRLGLAGHAAFETFSVLTRLPSPNRPTPVAVDRLITTNFPYTRFLSARGTESLLTRLAFLGVGGGAVYDALVASAALEHRTPLATRDRRAIDTYRALNVDVQVLA